MENFWIFDDFRKNYREISCIFTNYRGILVLHVLCFSLPPNPKNTHSPPNHPYPPNPQTPYDPLEVLIPKSYKYYSYEQLLYGNSNLIYQNLKKYVIKSLVLHLLCFSHTRDFFYPVFFFHAHLFF